ncbi:MAG: hypothetical protein A2092_15550 [Rhodobacteraceae bacterium GWE1_64_9]|nr:MAG: hypothetical protein A2092_15550 [Rhodobacteraceae bacterium GWE1_64_9]OHC48548.1 MAG: hypothetical protein A2X69_10775 [Rhodobacteraceae bacterium GWF1_65_7]HBD89835.1 hypothetical protein [Gemmobacter sp.]HBU15083.1 hypothetical protein [Gemmobacter sp.]
MIGAQAARDEASAVAATVGRYASAAAGLADTSVGETFWVYSDDYFVLYRHDAGPVAFDTGIRLPLAPIVDAAVEQVRALFVETRPALGKARDAPRGLRDAVRDAAGRVSYGAGHRGQFVAAELEFRRRSGRDGVRFHGATKDTSGRVASWYDRISGAFAAAAGFVDAVVPRYRSASRYAWSLMDRAGRAAIGVRGDGTVDLIPSAATIARIGGGYLPVDAFAVYDVANVRPVAPGVLSALRQEPDGILLGVRQIAGYTVAVIEHRGKLRVLFFYGQSNAGSSGVGNALVVDPLYPHSCLAFAGLLEGYRDTPVDPAAFTGLEPLRDRATEPQYPATLTAFALEAQTRAATGQPTPGILSYTAWYGGQPLTSFVRGTVPWANLMVGAEKSVQVAALYGREVDCPAIVWEQGEHGPFVDHKAQLIALAEDVTGELQSVMGLSAAPKFVVVQTSEYDDAATADTVFQDQLDAARDRPDLIVMAGPSYQYPLSDQIHRSQIGRMMEGETIAAALRELEATGAFVPQWPVGIVLDGSTITVTFSRPVAMDDDWVAPVPAAGFVVRHDSGVTAITDVALAGSTVTLTLAAAPAGANPRLEYAVLNDAASLNGWSNGRGLIYSPTDIPSTYHALGHALPPTVRHYSLRFTAAL